MMERLYNIIFEFKEYVVLTLCILFSLIAFALNDAPQIKHLRSIATVTFGIIQKQVSFIPRYFSLVSENEALRQKNIELADEAIRLREAKLENYRLRKLLSLQEESPYQLVAGNVVSKNLLFLRNTMTINIGTNNGVEEQMPVINEDGLVGLIAGVSKNYSIVNILLNTSFRVSGKDQRSRVDGIVHWDGTNLLFENVPKTMDVVPGDLIITSGYSQIFPPNIRIGIVKSIEDQEGSLFRKIVITPAVDFAKLEEVFVMFYKPDDERTKLETAINSNTK
ncbi:MAG TPA: rod shape-determining protein MreC [Bacteroidota bacterium]|nr:rod shape-determining protein MreC [Bacteroidota bacterium]